MRNSDLFGAICALIWVVTLFTLAIITSQHPTAPRLVGYGCDGTSGPIYADQEDYFPLCDNIEEN